MPGRRFRQQLAEVDPAKRYPEHGLEVRDDGGLDVLQVDGVPEGLLHRGHDSPVVAARPDLEELPQVGRHVEGEAVERTVAMTWGPVRPVLFPANPAARFGPSPRRAFPETAPVAEKDLFEA